MDMNNNQENLSGVAILAIDIGTTNLKTILFDTQLNTLNSHNLGVNKMNKNDCFFSNYDIEHYKQQFN